MKDIYGHIVIEGFKSSFHPWRSLSTAAQNEFANVNIRPRAVAKSVHIST